MSGQPMYSDDCFAQAAGNFGLPRLLSLILSTPTLSFANIKRCSLFDLICTCSSVSASQTSKLNHVSWSLRHISPLSTLEKRIIPH
jgi:hypothetical protein